jgi:lipopolysaccharide export LptBFGC system permease protein LptF
LRNVFIYDERRPGDPVAVVAKRGSILPIQAERELDLAHVLQLKDGNIHHNMRESSSYQKVDFQEYNLFLMINEGQNVAANTPKMKSWDQIMADRKTYSDRPDMMAEFDAEIWRRIATGISPLAFLILGLGFGVVRNRSPRLSATFVAFGGMVVYLLAESFSVNAVMNQGSPAWITMMSGNIIIAIVGIFAGFRSRWS